MEDQSLECSEVSIFLPAYRTDQHRDWAGTGREHYAEKIILKTEAGRKGENYVSCKQLLLHGSGPSPVLEMVGNSGTSHLYIGIPMIVTLKKQ